jgi:hypothetical protein
MTAFHSKYTKAGSKELKRYAQCPALELSRLHAGICTSALVFASILNVDMLAAFLDEKMIYKNIGENAYLLSDQFWEKGFCVYKN